MTLIGVPSGHAGCAPCTALHPTHWTERYRQNVGVQGVSKHSGQPCMGWSMLLCVVSCGQMMMGMAWMVSCCT